MGNSKSKKLKISEAPGDEKHSEERINTIKTDISDAMPRTAKDDDHKEKDHDNASSASTVEVLDDKWTFVTSVF